MAMGPMRSPSSRAVSVVLASLLALGLVLAASGTGRAAMEKPAYTAGDRWVYVLQGSMAALPGMNASEGGVSGLELNGIVEVDVVGPAAGGVRADTHASGYLNGTFSVTNMTIDVSGTFSSDSSEIWEGQDYLPVASNTTIAYEMDIKIVITATIVASVWVNETTAYGSLPPFNLSVGDSASAPFTTDLHVATGFSFFGSSQYLENSTSAAGAWTRQVRGQESVTVEAGTFSAYRLNESLGSFPGISAIGPASGANETAWFSNQVGNDVKRTAYLNGTPVAEMRLKSYTYPAPPEGLSLTLTVLIIAVPVAAAAILLLFLFRRRRRKRSEAPPGTSGAGPVGELPPRRNGGPP